LNFTNPVVLEYFSKLEVLLIMQSHYWICMKYQQKF
jgi:hypothetical protein